MGSYEIILTVFFLIVFVIFALCGVKICVQAIKESDKQLRKKFCRKAVPLMGLALMFLLCALYMLFRIAWFMLLVLIIGSSAVAYVIGTGVAANMRAH